MRVNRGKLGHQFAPSDKPRATLPPSGRDTDAFDIWVEDAAPADLIRLIEFREWRGFGLPAEDVKKARVRFAALLKQQGPLEHADLVYSSQDGITFSTAIK